MNFTDEKQAQEKGRQSFLKTLSELDGDVSIVRTKVKKLIADFTKSQENSSVELSSSLNRGVEIHRKVLCSLHKASSQGLLEPLVLLNKFCQTKGGTLKSFTIAQNNITSTLTILAPFINLEATLNKFKQDMANDEKLPVVITQSAKLSEYRSKILAKANEFQKVQLATVFKPLDDFEIYINSYIWKMIENAVEVAKKDPAALGKISRIIERIESDPGEKVKFNLAKGVEKRLEWLLGTDKLDELAENTHTAISELNFVLEKVVPQFPESYQLKNFCINTYRSKIESAIDPHLKNLDKLRQSPGLLVLIFQWVSEYSDAIKSLCPGATEEVEIQVLFSKVKELMPDFLSHMENLLSEWINRALRAHISNQQILELAATNDALTDTFPEEMFSAINQQLGFISNRLTGEVLIEVFRVCSGRLLSQQKKQLQQIQDILNQEDPEIQIPSFCLSINNNQRSSKHCLELQKFCQSKFTDPFHKERIENLFTQVHKGFLNLCVEGANCMALSMLISMTKETVSVLFTKRWINSRPVSLAFGTVEDFDSDITKWLASDFYVRKFRKKFFELFLQSYLERMIQALRILNNTNYDSVLLPKLTIFAEDPFIKKDIGALLGTNFREIVYRDKFEFMDYSNKFDIGFNCDTFFSGLLRIKEGGDLEPVLSAISPFIANSKDLVNAIATVLTGKVFR